MTPILADAINFPLVLGFGILILAPLLAFQVLAESFVLGRIWRLRPRGMWGLVLRLNCWSLLAGIPAKLLNSQFYERYLPKDLPSYFEGYAFAALIGILVYFGVTLVVEGFGALRWRSKEELTLSGRSVWTGIIAANVATYLVLAPLHYAFTSPTHQVQEFSRNTEWTANPEQTVLFIDSASKHLTAMSLSGSDRQVIVPAVVRDYLVSSNLNYSVYRSSDNNLYFHRRAPERTLKIWETKERFRMDQVTISPSGRFVAFASEEQDFIEVVEIDTGKRLRQTVREGFKGYDDPSLAWSTDENIFYVSNLASNGIAAVSLSETKLEVKSLATNPIIDLAVSYGRVSNGGWWNSYEDWGRSFSQDECDGLRAWCEPGLGSSLRIYSQENERSKLRFFLNVSPGLLHLANFYFKDVAFLPGCGECIFDTEGCIYLLDIEKRRVGTLADGERFSLLTSRYQKGL